MPSCAVYGCTNYSRKTKGTEIRYFRFPRTAGPDIAKEWINSCGRNNKINLKNACVCSIHFAKDSFEVTLRQRLLNYKPPNSRHLKPTAVPTEHLPKSTPAPKRPPLIEGDDIPTIFVEEEPHDDVENFPSLHKVSSEEQKQLEANEIKLETNCDDDQTEMTVFKIKIEEPPKEMATGQP